MAFLPTNYPSVQTTIKGGGVAKPTSSVKQATPNKGENEEKAARCQAMRSLLNAYKGVDKSCKFCPTHPTARTEWTAGKGYTRLKCLHNGPNKAAHYVNIFCMLENFNLDPMPQCCQVDVAYVLAKYAQEKRSMDAPVTFPLPTPKVSRAEAMIKVDHPENQSPERIIRAREAGQQLGIKNIEEREESEGRTAQLMASPAFSSDVEMEEAEEEMRAMEGEDETEPMEAGSGATPVSTNLPDSDLEKEYADIQAILKRNQAAIREREREQDIAELYSMLGEDWEEGKASPSRSLMSSKHADPSTSRNRYEGLVVDPLPTTKSPSPKKEMTPKAPAVKVAQAAKTAESTRKMARAVGREVTHKTQLVQPKGAATPSTSGMALPPSKIPASQPIAPKLTIKRRELAGSSDEEGILSSARTTEAMARDGIFRPPEKIGLFTRSESCPTTLRTEGKYTLEFNDVTRTFTFIRQDAGKDASPATYAATTAAHVRAVKAKAEHIDKLKTDVEYARRYVATGVAPKPPKVKTKLVSLYCRDMKAVPRNEMRVILRNIGVHTQSVVNIGFLAGRATYFTVPEGYAGECRKLLAQIAPSQITDDPIQAWGWYSKDGVDVLPKFAEKMTQEADDARKRGRMGLANFFVEYGASNIARCSPDVVADERLEEQKATELKRRHGWNALGRMAEAVEKEHSAWELAEAKRLETVILKKKKVEVQAAAKVDATTDSTNAATAIAANNPCDAVQGTTAPEAGTNHTQNEPKGC